jgi:heavy metal sensor kinase
VIESVRARLTFWFTGVFAAFLTLFAAAAYSFLSNTTLARVDEYLAETADAVAGALEAGGDEPGASRPELVDAVMREYRFRDIGVGVYDAATGMLVASNPAMHGRPGASGTDVLPPTPLPPLPPLPAGARRGGEYRATLPAAAGGTRFYSEPVDVRGGTLLVGTTRGLASHQRTLREARDVMLVGLPLALALAALGGYLFVRQTLDPVVAMSDRAARIGASTLHERLPVTNARDELGRLAGVFNELLQRLDESFDRQRQFMADASHELRTPVAIISGEAELALARDDRSSAELRGALAQVRDQGRRMRHIVEDLFLLARADAGEQPLQRAPLYVDDLAAEVTQSLRTLAEQKRIALEVDAAVELPLSGDEHLLRRMLVNLVENAIKYTPPGGRVQVREARSGDRYALTVTDTGSGIPLAMHERVFERFFRAEHEGAVVSNGGAPAGAGLGLAIARWIAEAHGGTLRLARSDERGSEFRVELPV